MYTFFPCTCAKLHQEKPSLLSAKTEASYCSAQVQRHQGLAQVGYSSQNQNKTNTSLVTDLAQSSQQPPFLLRFTCKEFHRQRPRHASFLVFKILLKTKQKLLNKSSDLFNNTASFLIKLLTVKRVFKDLLPVLRPARGNFAFSSNRRLNNNLDYRPAPDSSQLFQVTF